MDDPIRFAIHLVVLIYSLVLHECAHVGSALMLGDPTGKERGRLTLNPIPHIDLFWTIILPLVTFLSSGFAFGGAKPAPVNPYRMRNPREGMMWSALAGPATNILLAGLAYLALWTLSRAFPALVTEDVAYFLVIAIALNIVLAAFNLIPVPPLDGSRVLRYILGRAGEGFLDSMERFGMLPIFIAVYFLWPIASKPVFRLIDLLLASAFPH